MTTSARSRPGTGTEAADARPWVTPGSAMFFQWLVFDPNMPNGLAMSSAGKTLIY